MLYIELRIKYKELFTQLTYFLKFIKIKASCQTKNILQIHTKYDFNYKNITNILNF